LPNYVASLFPIRAAANLLIEASDELDWKDQRKVGLIPTLVMSPVEYAIQLFRESVVTFGQALVIARQSPESVKPAEATLNDPATRQQYEALFASGSLIARSSISSSSAACAGSWPV
jgi:hypothetical protein